MGVEETICSRCIHLPVCDIKRTMVEAIEKTREIAREYETKIGMKDTIDIRVYCNQMMLNPRGNFVET